MSETYKRIKNILETVEKEKEKRTISISLEEKQIEDIDKICTVFSEINNKQKGFSRNWLIEEAITAYITEAKALLKKEYNKDLQVSEHEEEYDTVIFPAAPEGFNEAFLKQHEWYWVRINDERKEKLKYIAIYEKTPRGAVAFYGKIKGYVLDEQKKKKKIILDGKPQKLPHEVILGSLDGNAMRSPRYTTLEKLKNANRLDEIF